MCLFVCYCRHSKAHALLVDTMLSVSMWVVAVLGLLLVVSLAFLPPVNIWKFSFMPRRVILWSARPVQLFKSFSTTQAGCLCV